MRHHKRPRHLPHRALAGCQAEDKILDVMALTVGFMIARPAQEAAMGVANSASAVAGPNNMM